MLQKWPCTLLQDETGEASFEYLAACAWERHTSNTHSVGTATPSKD